MLLADDRRPAVPVKTEGQGSTADGHDVGELVGHRGARPTEGAQEDVAHLVEDAKVDHTRLHVTAGHGVAPGRASGTWDSAGPGGTT